MISYKHLDLDTALVKFEDVFKRFCNTPEAVEAKDGLLVIYEHRGQNDKFEATNQRFIDRKCGTADQLKLADDQNKALAYRNAKKLFDQAVEKEKAGQNAQQEFLDSGQAFYAYYMSVDDTNADKDDALFAAANAYTRAGRPKTAISLYQIFLDKKEFRQSEYYLEAMFYIAKSYQAAFDYEKAGDMFLQVYKTSLEKGRKTRPEFKLDEARRNSLYNAAYLREIDRIYVDRSKNDLGAISLYKQYAKVETDPKKAAEGYFRIALIYKKQGKTGDMLQSFDTWRRSYAKDPAASPTIARNYVMSYYETAKATKPGKYQVDAWNKTIDAYRRVFNDAVAARQTTPEARADYDKALILSREWAGEARFRLADKFYKDTFENYKFHWEKLGNLANQAKVGAAIDLSYKKLDDVNEKAIREMLDVGKFESTWNLAALERIGDISYFSGDKVLSAGLPKEIERIDQQQPDLNLAGQYIETVETNVRNKYWEPEDEKKFPFGAKKYWLLTVETAKKVGLSNEWSKLAQQRLNAFIASDLYPVQRDDLLEPEVKP
jgi:tetratricopeptide (TPR) repeat protein